MSRGSKIGKKMDVGKELERKSLLRSKAEDVLWKKFKGKKKMTPEDVQNLIHELEVHQTELEMQNEELRQTQQALLNSRDSYVDLYDFAPVGYVTINEKELILKANITAADFLGTEREQMIKKTFSQFIFYDDQDIYYKYRQNLFDNKERLSCEVRMMKTGDRQFWVKLDSVPIKSIDDSCIHFQLAITDISEFKQVEENLNTLDNRFQNIFKLMKSGLGVYRAVDDGEDYIVVHSYRTELSMLGSVNEDLIGKRLLDVFPILKTQGLLAVFKRVWQTGIPEHYPVTICEGENVTGWRENYIYKLPSGEIVSIYEDITQKKKMELTLFDSEYLFRTIFEISPDSINFNRLKDGKFVAVNPRFLELLKYAKSDVIGKTAIDLNLWHDQEKRKEFFSQLYEKGKIKKFKTYFRCKNGSLIIAQISAELISYQNEPHLIAVTQDITELINAEQSLLEAAKQLENKIEKRTTELKESQINYRMIADYTYDWEWWTSLDGSFRYVSPACKRISGYKADEFIENYSLLREIIIPEDREKWDKHHKYPHKGIGLREMQFRIKRPDGEVRWIDHACQPVYTRENEFLGFRASNRDITQRKMAEISVLESDEKLRALSAQLLLAEEMERKRIADAIHDSIGQALSAIKFYVENFLTVNEKGSNDPAFKVLEKIVPLTQQTIEEVRRIIMDLRPSTLDDLGLKATISWFCREFQIIYTYIHVEKEIYFEETDIPDHLKTTIFRIVQEAFNNSAKHSKTEHISLKLKKNRDILELLVADNGCGFLVDRVLARHENKSGVGLASMNERVLFSGGNFSIDSTPGVGTQIKASWLL